MPALWSLMAAPRPPKPLPITAALRSLDCVVAMNFDRFRYENIRFLPFEKYLAKRQPLIFSQTRFSRMKDAELRLGDPEQVLATSGESFFGRAASSGRPSVTSARLYSFCRVLDDMATGHPNGPAHLEVIQSDLERGCERPSNPPPVPGFG
ncbi:MAG: hypothetical protein CM15mP18_3870 [Methanobacteriota archaeon]|nr:MAG: hypothetical protein CM15mP18_3870 [Euryarchaeota archaeon]